MSKFIHFRVSEWEYRKLKQKASIEGLTISDYIRNRIQKTNETLTLNEALKHLEKDIILLQWALEQLDDFVCACVCFISEKLKKNQIEIKNGN
jgi:repressor of nif and glnA expression